MSINRLDQLYPNRNRARDYNFEFNDVQDANLMRSFWEVLNNKDATVNIFWPCVRLRYIQKGGDDCIRDNEHLQYRWFQLEKDVNDFDDYYNYLCRHYPNILDKEEDRIKESHKLFEIRMKRPFTSIMAWRVMRELRTDASLLDLV
jgi:hypothetical protein